MFRLFIDGLELDIMRRNMLCTMMMSIAFSSVSICAMAKELKEGDQATLKEDAIICLSPELLMDAQGFYTRAEYLSLSKMIESKDCYQGKNLAGKTWMLTGHNGFMSKISESNGESNFWVIDKFLSPVD